MYLLLKKIIQMRTFSPCIMSCYEASFHNTTEIYFFRSNEAYIMRLNVTAEKPIIILTGLLFKFMKHSSGLFMIPGSHSIFPQSIHSPIFLDNVFTLPLPCVLSLTFHIQSLWDPVDLISNYIQTPTLSHYFHCHSSGLRYHYLPAFYLCSLSACLQ